jgi:hypothetical protein
VDPAPKVLRDKDGRERVLLKIAEFQMLLDAAAEARSGLPDIRHVVERLKRALEAPADHVDLDEFLAEYDAVHGEGS